MRDNIASPPTGLDKAGLACSGACAVHCALAPAIALFSPAAAGFFENEWIHAGLLTVLTPVAVLAFCRGLKLHQKTRPAVLGGVGIALLFMAVVFEALLKIDVEHLETGLTVAGCAFLVSAHIFNVKYARETSPA